MDVISSSYFAYLALINVIVIIPPKQMSIDTISNISIGSLKNTNARILVQKVLVWNMINR